MSNTVRVTVVLEFPKKPHFDIDEAVDEMYDRVVNGMQVGAKPLRSINIEVVDIDDMVVDSSENLYDDGEADNE